MPTQMLLGILRHALTWLGGWLLARGLLVDEAQAQLFSDSLTLFLSAAVTLAGLAWSMWRKFNAPPPEVPK
jgi:hypothetical protein